MKLAWEGAQWSRTRGNGPATKRPWSASVRCKKPTNGERAVPMTDKPNRRSFLRTATIAGATAGVAPAVIGNHLPPVSADEARPRSNSVQFLPEIESTVRWIEETPRDRLLEEATARIKHGMSFQELVTALQLAGVRNVQPRPSVGFKFHAVLVVNSARLASLAADDADRWLPLLWGLDYFKDSQARDRREGNWTMPPVKESAIPSAATAAGEFRKAMEQWDEPRADAAVAALARSAGSNEVFELFFRYGGRDFRSIGHKAIFVANAQRTLAGMGWQHAEPVLRSLAYALLNHHGEPNPATHDLEPDRPGRRNHDLAKRIREPWLQGADDDGAARELLATLRTGSDLDACQLSVELLNRGVSVESLWNGLFAGSAELVLRQPGIVALHAVTSTNALHHTFRSSGDSETRKLVLLQNAAFLPLFREALRGRGKVTDRHIDELPSESTNKPAQLNDVLNASGKDRSAAVAAAYQYLRTEPARPLIRALRRRLCRQARNVHDYKLASAAFEDYYSIGNAWRNHFLAATTLLLPDGTGGLNPLFERIARS